MQFSNSSNGISICIKYLNQTRSNVITMQLTVPCYDKPSSTKSLNVAIVIPKVSGGTTQLGCATNRFAKFIKALNKDIPTMNRPATCPGHNKATIVEICNLRSAAISIAASRPKKTYNTAKC